VPAKPTRPYGALLLCVVAGWLYRDLIVNVVASAAVHGPTAVADGIGNLILVFQLWVVLAVLLWLGRSRGKMPDRVAGALIPMHLFAGIAVARSTGLYSTRVPWVIVFPMLIPPLIATYAMWARLPQLHVRLPGRPVSVAIWGAVLVLSTVSMVLALGH
jgi:hypothetical protein